MELQNVTTNPGVVLGAQVKDGNELDKVDFLNLLIAQIRHQDPMSPMDNQQFISQLTQFTNIDQLGAINEKLEENQTLTQSLNNTMMLSLVGKRVTVQGERTDLVAGEASRSRLQSAGSGQADVRVVNAAGREVPVIVNGKERFPFAGVGQHRPAGRKHGPRIASCADYPADGDKRTPSLKDALVKAGLADGMVISTHHHFRNGDKVALLALEAAANLGAKDLMWLPSASFPCHEPVIDLMDHGVVHHIEGSMNGPLRTTFSPLGRRRALQGIGAIAAWFSNAPRSAPTHGPALLPLRTTNNPAQEALPLGGKKTARTEPDQLRGAAR